MQLHNEKTRAHFINLTHVDSKYATGTTQRNRLEKTGLRFSAGSGQNARGGDGRRGREGTEVVVHHVEVELQLALDMFCFQGLERSRREVHVRYRPEK